MGLELLEQDVGRDLEQDVGHEEDDEGVVVEGAVEAQLLGEAEDVCVGDVDPVCGARILGRQYKFRVILRVLSLSDHTHTHPPAVDFGG